MTRNSLSQLIVTSTSESVDFPMGTILCPIVWAILSKFTSMTSLRSIHFLIEIQNSVITNIRLLPWAPSILATVGGDCTFRLWDFVTGKELQSLQYKSYVEKYVPEGVDANSMDPMVMKMELSTKDNIAVLSFAK
jgi:WD40 repeat protein